MSSKLEVQTDAFSLTDEGGVLCKAVCHGHWLQSSCFVHLQCATHLSCVSGLPISCSKAQL